MARTAIKQVELQTNGFANPAPYTVIDQANGMVVQEATGPHDADSPKLLLHVKNTDVSDHDVIVRAGVTRAADLTKTIPAGGEGFVGPLNLLDYQTVDHLVNVDFSAGFTGEILALRIH